MKRLPALCLSLILILPLAVAEAVDWTQFRGPGGLATSAETGLPLKWADKENITWRTELPGAGTSSPIVLKNRVYLTCYTGYGMSREDPGKASDLLRHVVCVDRSNGKILWTKEFKPIDDQESRYSGNGARHGFASSTPTTDGEHLYVFFGKSGVYCLDLDGKEVWHVSVGTKTAGWGSSNSPVLYKNLVIINAGVESNAVVGLDKKTGKAVWTYKGTRSCWSTPVLVPVADGTQELVLNTPRKILALDPATGKELWNCEGIPDGYVCPSVVAHEGIVYAIGGRKNTAIAVRAGGRGDVTKTHRLWTNNKGSNVCSPVYHNGHIYWVHDGRGTAYCLDAKTGNVEYEQRLAPRPGTVYSSMIVADGKLYCQSQHAGTFVIAAKPKFELLAHNTIASDNSRANASPVVSNGELLLRSDKYLICIGKKD